MDTNESLGLHHWRPIVMKGDIPAPRSGAASVVRMSRRICGVDSDNVLTQIVDDKLYIFGGYGGNGRLDDFHEFDFSSFKWKRLLVKGSSPCARENNGVVSRSRQLYLFGGYDGSVWLNDFHEFDIDSCTWKQMTPRGPIPSGRFGFVSAICRDSFVLFGGYDGTAWLNDLHIYDFGETCLWRNAVVVCRLTVLLSHLAGTSAWLPVAQRGNIPSIRSCPSWVVRNGCVYMFGGYDGVQVGSSLVLVGALYVCLINFAAMHSA